MTLTRKGYDLTFNHQDQRISYNDVGEGEVPVIFLHGYPFNKSTWNQQVEYLKASNRVIAMDMRGFGNTSGENTTLSIDLFADDVIGLMDHLSVETAIICGLSMGGYIALNAQKRYPSRFEAMILCDTQCGADSAEGKQKRYDTIDTIESGGAKEFKEGFVQKVFCEHSLTHKKDLVEALATVVSSTSQQALTAGLVALAERTESCSTLADIAIPTLILCGREDALTPVALSIFMYEQIEGSMLHVIENAGHVSNLEQPDEFNLLLKEFVAGIA
ncbi:alpha/beta fold hydrolase [bacterium]|nr:alpha/beta fold hydrolase [bacterium]